jgi:hypothetical protein
VILLAALCAACSSPTRGKHTVADAAPPKPFEPYSPPFQPSIPAAGGQAAVGGGAAGTDSSPSPTGTGFAGMPSMPFPTGSGGTAGPGPSVGPGAAGMAAAGQGGFPPDPDAGPPPASALCANMNRHGLPFDISNDFTARFVLQPQSFSVIDFPNCDQTFFPDAAPSPPPDFDGGIFVDPDAGAPLATVTGCSAFKYDPDACVAANGGDPVTAGPSCWAGVIFTPTLGGPLGPGVCIDRGAMTIHFKARASKDGARVKFGSIREGLGTTEFFLNLTRDWRSYTIMIPAGEDYDSTDPSGGVWNGFSVVLEDQDHAGGTYVLVADVIWDR